MQTIVQMVFGSHLYGTATPQSDRDYKAVYIPEPRDIILGRVKDVIVENTKTDGSAKNGADDIDREAFALQKYLHLCAQGNTVAMDMLFADSDSITSSNHIWHQVVTNKDKLLSRQCQSYISYCRAQSNKYGLKGSRMAAAEKAAKYFAYLCVIGVTSSRMSTLADNIERMFANTKHVEFVDITMPNGSTVRHLSVCGRKVPYTATIKTAYEVYNKLWTEYGERARKAKDNEGIDWKALSHAVRVGHQSIELLTTGHITFPRPEAAHLVAIKTGQVHFDQVSEEVVNLLGLVEAAAESSTLPDQANRQWIDDFVYTAYRRKVL